MKKIVCLFVCLFVCSANSATFTYNGNPLSNVDTSAITSSTFNVAGTGTIDFLEVFVNISSPYADDMDLWISHGGVTTMLYNGVGDTFNSSIDATFSDIAILSAPVNGSAIGLYLPVDSLIAFNGLSISGDWSLLMQDSIIPGDGNNLVSWGISGTTSTVPAPAVIWLLGSGLVGLFGVRKKSVNLSGKHA